MSTQQRLARAAEAYGQRDLAAAERECRAILALYPSQPDAMHLLGLVLRLKGDLAAAEPLLRASVEREPQRAEFRFNFGNLLRAAGRLPEAEQQYRSALVIDPAARPARLALARLLVAGGVPDAAEREARQLVDRDARDADAWAVVGAAQRAQDRLADAETSYRRALAVRPEHALARHNLGALLGQLQRADESLAELDRAARLGATSRELHFNRGRALIELGRFDEADDAIRAALKLSPTDLGSHTLLAKLRFMRGDPDYMGELADVATKTNDPRLLLALGDLLRRGDRLEEAETIVRRLVERHGWMPQAASALAVLLQEQGRLPEAAAEARRAQAAAPEDPDLTENLIAILLQLGEGEEPGPLIQRERRRAPLDQRWLAYEATAARITGSSRYEELYDYERFVRPFDLEPPDGYPDIESFNAALRERLIERHRLQAHPLDQSLRLGTQTSRSLLVDPDPVIQAFIRALQAPIATYREAIGFDAAHPYLERNLGTSRIVGCWSVRLRRGGYHVNHVHPEGWLSSAYYVEVPAEVEDEEMRSGWIKFGEPRMPVPGAPPAHFVQPRAGRLVLFPSYMWHGTTPITGEAARMTVAFDAVPEG